jgi:hypothetical protein
MYNWKEWAQRYNERSKQFAAMARKVGDEKLAQEFERQGQDMIRTWEDA